MDFAHRFFLGFCVPKMGKYTIVTKVFFFQGFYKNIRDEMFFFEGCVVEQRKLDKVVSNIDLFTPGEDFQIFSEYFAIGLEPQSSLSLGRNLFNPFLCPWIFGIFGRLSSVVLSRKR